MRAWGSSFLVAGLALVVSSGRLHGQVGSSTDILMGTVTDERGQPRRDVVVEAQSIETKITRTAKTDAKGRYTILFPDGGGQYQLTFRSIGVIPVQRRVARQTDEDRIVTDVRLSAMPQQLAEVTVRARPTPPPGVAVPTPGATERNLNPDQVARLPIDASDLNLLATLAPGVVNVRGTDSTSQSFSVAGQRPNANAITLDGLSFGTGAIPQDAIRSAQVITSSYDPSRGQFSGGQIASTTRGGTNVTQGTFNYGFRDRGLTVSADGGNPFITAFTQHQGSFGLGGPLKKDRLFLFASLQGRLRSDGVQSLLSAPAVSLERLGAAPDSVSRFLSVVRGLDAGSVTTAGATDRSSDDFSSIVRLDYIASPVHTITLRGDYRRNVQDPTRVFPLSLPTTGGRATNSGGGAMATVSSRAGAFINELKGYVAGSSRSATLATELPQGRVQLVSDLTDGAVGVSSLTFGGNPGLPQSARSRTTEITEELSWLPGSGAHRLKIGLLYSRLGSTEDASFNRYGTFSYNSLADLEAGRPASFSRTLSATVRDNAIVNMSAYLADHWRVSRALQLSVGGRLERTRLTGAPAANPAIEAAFDRRTDAWPSEVRVSPRAGFTWIVGGLDSQSPPKLFVRGGLGEFRSTVPSALVTSAQAAPGFTDSEAQLVCLGSAVPAVNWAGYRADPGAIPSQCAGAATAIDRNPTATVFGPNFAAPRAWRGSLGVTRRLGLSMIGIEASWARGKSQSGFSDLNLGGAQFGLGAEAGRPVYVAATAIDTATGATSLFQSRRSPAFGQVLQIDSDLESESHQMTITAMGFARNGAVFNLSYTWAKSRDQSSGSMFGGAQRGFATQTTGVDPNLREWATSDFDRRHSFLATLTLPITESVELTTIGRMTSGAPYTPLVGSDINGDGAINDRAFIFGPNSADPTVTAAMSALVAGGSGGAACLLRQAGTIAGRNSCQGPWQPSLDLQLNIRPNGWSLKRRLAVSLVTSNFLAGLDELVHGVDGLKGWGQNTRPEATLLYVDGFDQTTGSYRYVVNQRFGTSSTTATAIRDPFQLAIQARYTVGPDRQREMMASLRGGGPAGFFSRLASIFPNPAREVIGIRIALRLDDDQVGRLKAIADSFETTIRNLSEAIRKRVDKAGANPDLAQLMAGIRPSLDAARSALTASLVASERVLSPTQWAQVPDRIKNPRIGPGGPGGPGAPPGGPPPDVPPPPIPN